MTGETMLAPTVVVVVVGCVVVVDVEVVDVVVVVGAEAAGIADEISAAAGSTIVIRTEGRDDALAWVRQNAAPEDVVLVKASRGAALEWVADQLLEETTP